MDSRIQKSRWIKRILLIEDNPDHGFLIKTRLNKLDKSFAIDIAETAENALVFLEKENIDIILLDYELPGINGIDFLHELREREINVPCIFLTGQGSEQIAINALREGASDYFTKEEGLARYERLVNSINKAINKVFIERELEDYRRFLESIIDTIPDPVFIKDREHRWVVLNQALCDMLGYSKKDMLLKSDYDFFPVKEADFFWKKDEEMFTTGEKIEIPEEPITDSHGNVHYLNTIKVPLRNADREITHLVGMIRDITEKKLILEKLRRSEEYYRSLIENSLDGITVINKDGTVRYQSSGVQRTLGYREEEMTGHHIFNEFIHPDDRADASALFQELLKTPGDMKTMEVRVLHKDGSWKVFEAVGTNLLHNPVVEGVVINSRDLTERKKAQEEIRAREEQLRLILENTMDVIYSVAPDGIITYISPQVLNWGYPPEEIIGKSISQFVHPEDVQKLWEELQITIEKGREFLSYFRILTRDGSVLHIEEYGKAIYEEGKIAQVTGVLRDVTTRLKAEEELKSKNQELEGFIQAVAHDLKTPMATIREYCTLALKQSGDRVDKELMDILRKIKQNSDITMEMLKGLQDYAKYTLRKERFEVFNLRMVLQEVVADLTMRADFSSVKVRIQDGWPEINGDRTMYYQIFLNLVENAAKYGGTEIDVTWKSADNCHEFCVKDNGVGIEEDFIDKVFDMFSRASNVPEHIEGVGMGLALVKKAVEKHGGKVRVESASGKGSAFFIMIPQE